jgi:hypothetical protein
MTYSRVSCRRDRASVLPEVEIETEECETSEVVSITYALNCTSDSPGRPPVTVCCVVVQSATARVRIIATTAKTAATTNGNNFTSPEGKVSAAIFNVGCIAWMQ